MRKKFGIVSDDEDAPTACAKVKAKSKGKSSGAKSMLRPKGPYHLLGATNPSNLKV